ncbi:arginine deiminase [Limosilactobacillus mucosae]|uniref:Arginine deiminase n=1 Tax=Limosilactobacillus mucosae TaxID=97478 RepID=A0AAJ1HQV6_LIMMU|nr:arginine deiminase [Limosilactobacillus mucosae]MDC2829021.1 arginine deiminase [Limosilactobacillus mucosae]MDC2836442.1 arginine deiminase [Limosilactobacillus mucosae]MDC2848488.1 arginine deiminase [Limosilactobacillus mucosae]MDC2852686.1 arginine deiminase [Limosilactobacillus mucosae]
MPSPIHVTSEIGKLKTVMLHRPGREIENLTPDSMYRLLFDDIPYLPIAQEEHDYFAQTLRDQGIEVLYFEKLAAEALADQDVKEEFVDRMVAESGYAAGLIHDVLKEYLLAMNTQDMVNKIFEGVRREEIDLPHMTLQQAAEDADWPFVMDPMPNAYFTRDPQASIGDGLSINRMTFPARQRESLITEYIIKHHPRFAGQVNVWRDRNHETHIEGGDELVLSDHVFAIGISQRTTADAIEDIAKNLFKKSNYDTVIAIKIPHNHAMMHLDTVFTMIDYDKFTVHPAILDENGQVDNWVLHPGKDGEITMEHHTDIKEVLKKALNKDDIDLIPTGNGDPIIAAREQWNDGSNTLAIAPGEVVTYNRNYVSNDLLRKHGILVHEVRSSELSRGRGGPRCMSCPIVREDL